MAMIGGLKSSESDAMPGGKMQAQPLKPIGIIGQSAYEKVTAKLSITAHSTY